jgi:methylated-DNA-protein-cysteine methyltransferase related protein
VVRERVYAIVRLIPRGTVATYGQIAHLAGMPRAARQVGRALATLDGAAEPVPWHRVVNAQGTISRRVDPAGHETLQRALLESEGVRFDAGGKLSLTRYQCKDLQARTESTGGR